MSALGRWTSVDPLSDDFPAHSPFNYVMGNPLSLVDPTGMAPQDDYYIRNNGEIGVVRTDDDFDIFSVENADGSFTQVASMQKNENGLIQLPERLQMTTGDPSDPMAETFGWGAIYRPERERYASGKAVAALIGAVHETGTSDLSIGRFSFSNGMSPPTSRSHTDGENGDIRALRNDYSGGSVTTSDRMFDFHRNTMLVHSLKKFGWKDIRSEARGGL